MTWKLTILDHDAQPVQTFEVPTDRPLLIGRGTASDTQIRDPALSRIHCRVYVEAGRLVVEDADSTGGTFVRGLPIKRETVDIDDLIAIGSTRLKVQNDNPLDSRTYAAAIGIDAAQARPMIRTDELAGQKINRFELQKLVAKGHSSVVYKALDLADGKTVAIKILHPQLTLDDRQQERFIRAMRTMMPVRNPHIVRLLRAGRHRQLCWVAMDWISGSNLSEIIEWIGIRGALDWKDIWRVAVHVGRALVEAEKRKLVHRNVTPTNILRRDQDKAYLLTDLVFAKALSETAAAQLTRPGELVGELAYLAPELISNPMAASSASDRFSLGVTLYVLATGKHPFDPSSVARWMEQVTQHTPTPPATDRLGFDERFSDLIMKLLTKNPSQRFGSTMEMLIDLERVGKFGGLDADWSEWI